MIRAWLAAATLALAFSLPASAQHCDGCDPLQQVREAYQAARKAIDDAIASRTRRLDDLTGKALGPGGLTPAEREEAKRIGDEMQQLIPARDATKKTAEDLQKAIDDCAKQCRAEPALEVGKVLTGVTEADLAHLDVQAACPECEPAARDYNTAFKRFLLSSQEEQELGHAVARLERQVEDLARATNDARWLDRLRSELDWMKGQSFLGMQLFTEQIPRVQQLVEAEQARLARVARERATHLQQLRSELDSKRRERDRVVQRTAALKAASDAAQRAYTACNRERCIVVADPGTIGMLPGGERLPGGDSVPDDFPSDPAMAIFARVSRELSGSSVAKADCPACMDAQRAFEAERSRLKLLESESLFWLGEQERTGRDLAQVRDQLARADGFPGFYGITLQNRAKQFEDDLLEIAGHRRRVDAELGTQERRVAAAREALMACNRERCGTDVSVARVIGIAGNNPFDPSNPTGPIVVTSQPPVPGAIGALQLSSPSYAGAEGGAVLITVVRSGGSTGNVSVRYATTPGTASQADFTAAEGTLSWPDGDATPRSFSIALPPDTFAEVIETFTVTLSTPGGGATLGVPSSALVSISDGSLPPQPAGAIQLSASSYAVMENAGSVTVMATRTGGSAGEVTVQFFTGPASATAGSDYTATNGVLTWGAGDMAPKSFTVPIVNDTAVEGPETFFVTLNNPTGGATLGAPGTATVTINDDDVNTGPCGATGNAWTPNAGQYACGGSCSPSPSPRLSVNGDLVTATAFASGGTATFQGCGPSLQSRESNLTYFGQANHRATITRSSDTNFNANIVSSGGGTCAFSCTRTGP